MAEKIKRSDRRSCHCVNSTILNKSKHHKTDVNGYTGSIQFYRHKTCQHLSCHRFIKSSLYCAINLNHESSWSSTCQRANKNFSNIMQKHKVFPKFLPFCPNLANKPDPPQVMSCVPLSHYSILLLLLFSRASSCAHIHVPSSPCVKSNLVSDSFFAPCV